MPGMEGSCGLYPGFLLGCHQSSSMLCHLDELCHFANDFQPKGWDHMVMSSLLVVCQYPVEKKNAYLDVLIFVWVWMSGF